jgi:hypothetical protein
MAKFQNSIISFIDNVSKAVQFDWLFRYDFGGRTQGHSSVRSGNIYFMIPSIHPELYRDDDNETLLMLAQLENTVSNIFSS